MLTCVCLYAFPFLFLLFVFLKATNIYYFAVSVGSTEGSAFNINLLMCLLVEDHSSSCMGWMDCFRFINWIP